MPLAFHCQRQAPAVHEHRRPSPDPRGASAQAYALVRDQPDHGRDRHTRAAAVRAQAVVGRAHARAHARALACGRHVGGRGGHAHRTGRDDRRAHAASRAHARADRARGPSHHTCPGRGLCRRIWAACCPGRSSLHGHPFPEAPQCTDADWGSQHHLQEGHHPGVGTGADGGGRGAQRAPAGRGGQLRLGFLFCLTSSEFARARGGPGTGGPARAGAGAKCASSARMNSENADRRPTRGAIFGPLLPSEEGGEEVGGVGVRALAEEIAQSGDELGTACRHVLMTLSRKKKKLRARG
eukprot:scaffold27701_cov101-Isochrysis_galbana.AAC.4